MLKKALLTVFVMFLFTTSYSQNKEKIKGDRNLTIQETKINSFNKIVVGDKFKIDLIEGESASVFVETDSNLHDVIRFNVADSTLYFDTSHRITSSKKMDIKVTYTKTLKEIETIEDGEVSSLTSINLPIISLKHSGTSRAFLNIKATNFNLINNGRAKLKLNVTTKLATLQLNENTSVDALFEADSIQVDLYQRAEAKIEGNVSYLNVRADNSTNFVGKELTATNCEVVTDLTCDVYVQVSDSLQIEASGSSEVYIYNNPKITLNKFVDTAKIHKKELKSQ
jgi:hypothetical protein